MSERIIDLVDDIYIVAIEVNGFGYDRRGLTRCHDCKKSRENGWKCTYWAHGRWDDEQEADVITLADVRPDGFCFKAERREA